MIYYEYLSTSGVYRLSQPVFKGSHQWAPSPCPLRQHRAAALAIWQRAALRQSQHAWCQHPSGVHHFRDPGAGSAVSILSDWRWRNTYHGPSRLWRGRETLGLASSFSSTILSAALILACFINCWCLSVSYFWSLLYFRNITPTRLFLHSFGCLVRIHARCYFILSTTELVNGVWY